MSTGTSRRNERSPRSVREPGSGGAPGSAGRTAPGGALPTLGLAFDLDVRDRLSRLLPVGDGLLGLGGAGGLRLLGLGGAGGLRLLGLGRLCAGLFLRRGCGQRGELALVEPPLFDARP